MSVIRGIRNALVLALALIVSGFAIATAPDNDEITGPIATTAPIGETASTRQFDVLVHGVTLADNLDVSYGDSGFSFVQDLLKTDGVWVVVDLTLTSRYDYILLQNSEIKIDGYAYRTSSLLSSPTVAASRFGPGIPVRGPMVFELPRAVAESVAARSAVIEFKTELTPQLEGVTRHPVDLTALAHDRIAVVVGAAIDENF